MSQAAETIEKMIRRQTDEERGLQSSLLWCHLFRLCPHSFVVLQSVLTAGSTAISVFGIGTWQTELTSKLCMPLLVPGP